MQHRRPQVRPVAPVDRCSGVQEPLHEAMQHDFELLWCAMHVSIVYVLFSVMCAMHAFFALYSATPYAKSGSGVGVPGFRNSGVSEFGVLEFRGFGVRSVGVPGFAVFVHSSDRLGTPRLRFDIISRD